MLAIVVVLTIVSLPAQANRQDKQEKIPCPTPTPVVYSMSADLQPKISHQGKALYTVKARDEKIEGRVVLNALFHESGRITDIRIIKELPHGLTEQAIGTAYRIKFTPAMKDGKPVSVRGSLVYDFDLY
jgi:TonB family protein